MNLQDKREYIYRTHTEPGTTLFSKLLYPLKDKYWKNKVANMSEGEVLNTYYTLTRRSYE